MRKIILLIAVAALASRPAAHAQTLAAFGDSTPDSMPVLVGQPIFTSGLVSILGSVDYTGPASQLTGTVVINGDLRLSSSSPLVVKATGKLFVYGNLFVPAGGLTVEPGGTVYFYGDQLAAAASTAQTGGGLFTFSSPRPNPGGRANGQRRPSALDGLDGGTAIQYVDGGATTWNLDVDHRSTTGLALADLNGDGSGNLAVGGTFSLNLDNAALSLGDNTLALDQRNGIGQLSGYSELRYATTTGRGRVSVLGLPDGASFTYPIGNSSAGDYTPAQVTNRSGAAASLSMAVSTSATPTVSSGINRYWQLVSDAPATVDVVLEHNLATNDATYNNNQAAVFLQAGSGAWQAGGGPSSGTASGTLTTGAAITGASDLGQALLSIAAGATQLTKESITPLPVSLVSFGATRTAGAVVQVKWATASELNNKGFEVQRSFNGTSWAAIGYVAGKGTTSMASTYELVDNTSAAAYYRLLQQDNNGKSSYSPVRTVGALATEGLVVYPNPTRGTSTVSGHNSGKEAQLVNSMGQVVAVLAVGQSTLDVSRLPAGVYVLHQDALHTRLVVQ